MQFVDHGLESFAAAREYLGIDEAVTKSKRTPAVKIDLIEAQTLNQFYPIIDGLFVEIAEIKKIRTARGGSIPGPGAAEAGFGQFRRFSHDLLHHRAQFAGGTCHQGGLGAGKTEPRET